MLFEIWSLRHFWLALARYDVKERYRRSWIGIGWSLLKPAALTLILSGIFSNVFEVSLHEYVPFLFLGLITWQFLSESILQGCHAFRLGRTYLRVRPIPLAIFPLRIVLSAGVNGSIALTAGLIAIAYLHGSLTPIAILSLIPTLLILALTAWSLACICAILHTIYADTQQIAEISLQVLFYATPVIYLPESVRKTGWMYWLMECNPFSALLDLVRKPLLHGEIADASSLLIALTFLAGVSTIAMLLLRRNENRVILTQ